MKKHLLFAIFIGALSLSLKAQWQLPGNFGRTMPNVNSIGVGFFPTSGPLIPAARLHVNYFYLADPFNPGLLSNMFRTDGLSKYDNKWQLYTGSSAASSFEKFLLMVPLNSNHVLLQSTQPGANISFNTGGPNFRMIILGTNGFVGIGTPTPNNLLDVDGGDIDVNTSTRSYMIADKPVLWHKGNVTNILVGVGAGLALGSGNANTFVGNNAGGTIASANQNTMVGFEAGPNAGGNKNTFMGYHAGFNYGPNQVVSTFIGAEAGYSESLGDEHVMVGWKAGYNTNGAVHNTFVGNISGINNTTGGNNTFIGIGSGGANTTGTGNTALGAGAGMGVNNLQNAAAIGSGASVMNSNNMILGINSTNVGIGLSGATAGPANKLEIDAGLNGTSAVAAGLVGASGLRFRDLHSQTLTIPNPGLGVLSVDLNGDVIYVPSSSSSGSLFGNLCTGAPVSMPGNWEIPTAGFNYMFNDIIQGGSSEVGIGHLNGSCGNLLSSKFEVFSDRHQFAGFFDNSANLASQVTYGVFGHANSTSDGAVGVKGYAQGAAANGVSIAVGVEGESTNASGSAYNYGVNGIASNGGSESRAGNFVVDNSPSPTNFGVKSVITTPLPATLENYAGYFETTNVVFPLVNKSFGVAGSIDSPLPGISVMPIGTTIAVYGYNPRNTAGMASSMDQWAGYFDGDMNVNGSAWWWGTNWQYSDRRLKKNITPLENMSEKIKKLNGYSYNFRQDEFKGKNFDNKTHIGFIAQEIKAVFPELVNEDSKGYIAVNYEGMIPVLLQAAKEQQATIENQQKQIDELKGLIMAQLDAFKAATDNSLSTSLSDKNSVVLNQNVPNPFAESTLIGYTIPEDARDAQLQFFNNSGQLLKVVVIAQKGKGSLTVFADDLSNGVYHYSLVVDGKIVDTKKMIKSN